MAWYAKPTEALAGEFQTDLNVGLKADEVVRRQAQEGPNELPDAPPPSLLKLFLSQFKPHRVGADRGGHCVRVVGRLDRCSGDSGHRVSQWCAGVCAGVPSRAIVGGSAQDVGRDGPRHSRRCVAVHSGTGTGHRRCGRPRSG
ncbi:MAG: cation-transporting P-type ATPase [Nitrospira sp.]